MADGLAVAVFADSGKTRFRAVSRDAGLFFASRRARVIIVPSERAYPRFLVNGALENGGTVLAIAAPADMPPGLPQGVAIQEAANRIEALRMAARTADVLVGLPGNLPASAALYSAWTSIGGASSGKPVGLLNRKKAFEVVRGFIGDVAAVGLGGRTDRLIQFSDNLEDLWTRLDRLRS